MHALLQELFSLAEELSSQDNDRGRPITDLIVLRLGDVYENSRGSIVNVDGLFKNTSVCVCVWVGGGCALDTIHHQYLPSFKACKSYLP